MYYINYWCKPYNGICILTEEKEKVMTNYEWVKENQKGVIKEALVSNMKLHSDKVAVTILNDDDAIREAIIARCSVYKPDNIILLTSVKQLGNGNYIMSYNDVANWLGKERELPLLYPIGTAVIDPSGEVWFYNGRDKYTNYHYYVASVQKIGKKYSDCGHIIPKGVEYVDEKATVYFKPIKFGDVKVVDNYVNAKGEE